MTSSIFHLKVSICSGGDTVNTSIRIRCVSKFCPLSLPPVVYYLGGWNRM